VNNLSKKVELACAECHRIIEVATGNLGWCLKSNNDLIAKSKKALVQLVFLNKNGLDPSVEEHKALAKELKDDIERVKPTNPECPFCPGAHLSSDWQGYVVVLNPKRSEISSILNIERAGNYALKVNVR
jgi:DNA-directed RNA polymerase subunit E"|tara:strand:- start:58 stop:444 length:387 start_codon:yes stop_codon:yes gene_type:complete